MHQHRSSVIGVRFITGGTDRAKFGGRLFRRSSGGITDVDKIQSGAFGEYCYLVSQMDPRIALKQWKARLHVPSFKGGRVIDHSDPEFASYVQHYENRHSRSFLKSICSGLSFTYFA